MATAYLGVAAIGIGVIAPNLGSEADESVAAEAPVERQEFVHRPFLIDNGGLELTLDAPQSRNVEQPQK